MIIRNSIGKVYLACGVTDFRKSINGLALLVQYSFDLDPFSNCLFVFCNRNKDKLKILQWEHDGFWLHYKRLEKGKFKWPDKSEGIAMGVTERELGWLLDGLPMNQPRARKAVDERIMI
jgi:transposase